VLGPRRINAAILIVSAILFVPPLFLRGHWSPDEPRYAAVSWQMRSSGDVLVPRINDELYPEKPPLFFYLAALVDLVVPPDGGRVVESAAMVLLALVVARFAAPAGPEAQLAAALILLTSLLSLSIGKFGVIDSVFIGCMVAGIAFGRAALGRERPVGAWLACYASLALGTLVKGPVIIPFAILAIAVSRIGLTVPGRRGSHVLGHVLGLLLFAGLIAAWVVPACAAGGTEYSDRLLGQIAGRVSGARKTHIRPWYYYCKTFSFVFFPWTLVLLASLRSAWRDWRRDLWLLAWFLAGFVLLSLIASKRERYLFLILPAGATLAAQYLACARFDRFDRVVLRATAAILVGCGIALALAGAGFHFAPQVAGSRLHGAALEFLGNLRPWQLWVACPLLGAAAIASGVAAWRSIATPAPCRRFVLGTVAFVLATSLAFDLVITPAMDPLKTGARLTENMRQFTDAGGNLYLFLGHQDGRFNLALGRRHFPVLRTPEAAKEALARPDPAAIFVEWEEDLHTPPFGPGVGHVLAWGYLGDDRYCLLGNHAARELHPGEPEGSR
jgi:4-amino-4-deoxy-L-arabinose transferase-like glycosyltransferase